jgi:hypothetical protein
MCGRPVAAHGRYPEQLRRFERVADLCQSVAVASGSLNRLVEFGYVAP